MGRDEQDEQVEDLDETEDISDEDRVVLVDEDGNEVDFVLLATLELDGNEYAVLGPEEQVVDPEREEVELTFFKIGVDDDGEEEFLPVEDEEEFEAVREAVAELLGLAEADEDYDGGDIVPEA